jgi:monothiol bacilliredoxin
VTFERLTPDLGPGQLDSSDPVWIFKHSLTCPVSSRAMVEVSAFKHRNPALRVVLVEVQPERRASRDIAEHYGIPHASPQVILAVNGAAVWTASHFGICGAALDRSITQVDRRANGTNAADAGCLDEPAATAGADSLMRGDS